MPAKAIHAAADAKKLQKRLKDDAKLCARNDEYDARSEAEKAVRDSLKAPSTARFGPARATHGGCDWTVTGTVDSQNTFGAMLRANYRVTLKRTSKDSWLPMSVKVDQ